MHKPRLYDASVSARERLRKFASFITFTGIIPPPGIFRPFGISAMVIARNEEDWVETSIRSILGHADEVVISDHGSEDETGEIMESLAEAYPGKIRLVSLGGDEPFHEALNLMIDKCKYQWVLRFSADFVARTSGPCSIDRLLDTIRRLDRRRYFCIRLSGVALQGDIEHQYPRRRDRPEHILYTYSPWLRYEVQGQWESLHVPAFYEKLAPRDAYYFHMGSVKPATRVIQKLYWHRWFDARNKGGTIALRDFATSHSIREWGGSTLEEAAKNFILLEFQGCIPYSRELCGEYPDILVPALENPPFKLVFKDGKLVDRIERGRYRPQNWSGE